MATLSASSMRRLSSAYARSAADPPLEPNVCAASPASTCKISSVLSARARRRTESSINAAQSAQQKNTKNKSATSLRMVLRAAKWSLQPPSQQRNTCAKRCFAARMRPAHAEIIKERWRTQRDARTHTRKIAIETSAGSQRYSQNTIQDKHGQNAPQDAENCCNISTL